MPRTITNITMPAPWHPFGRGQRGRTEVGQIGLPITGSRGELSELSLQLITTREHSRIYNDMMRQHHYLGYQPLPGAQLRYLIHGDSRLLGGLGFGAAAWKIAPRDRFIGWSPAQRQARLHLIANNARFLLLPWVKVRFLASSVLALAARRLPADWQARYGYQLVLLETFVERPRFAGTSYRAANWICVGQTQGRGKLDRFKQYALPVKDIYLYPLRRDFRNVLTSPPAPAGGGSTTAQP